MMATPQFPVPPPKPAAYNTNAPNSSGAPNTEKLKEIDEDELPLSEFPHSEGFKHRPVQRRATAPTRRQDPSPQFNQPSRPHHKPSHPHPPPKPQNGLEHRRSLHPHPQQPPRYKRKIGPYTLTKTLGAGSMGKVKLGIHEVDHSKVAVKIIPRKVMESSRSASNTPVPANVASPSPGDRSRPVDSDTVPLSEASMGEDKRVLREVSILALLYHPYIVQLVDFVITTHYYYLVFEYVEGGQMLDYIISHGKLSERVARKFIRQIVSSLDYCHKNSIVHRDLKIENILISNSGDIKIIDFGLSNLYSSQSHLSTFCGSLYFAAPELLRAHAYTGPEVDLWSLGIVLYVLVCGKVPFDDQSMAVLHAKIKRGVVEYPSFLSSECRHLISRLLVTDPSERADMIEVKNHPWLSKGYPGPPDSYIPQRQPIQLPIDMKVVEKLSGFQLGSKEGVKNQIINATKELANNADSKYAPGVQLKVNKNQFRSGGRAPVKAPLSYPAASLYYLAKEKIERDAMGEAAKQLTFPVDQEVGSSSSANANSSSSNATSSSHLHPNSNVRRSTSGVARSKSCRPAVDGRYPPMQRGTFQNRSVRNSTPQSQDAPKPDANTAGRWSDVEAPRPTSLTPNPPRKVPSSSPLTTKSEHISTSSDNSDTKPNINIEPGVISAPSSTAPESKNPENLRVSALAINEKAGKPERKPSKLKKFGQLLLTRGPSMREARRKSPSAVSSPTTSDAPHSIQGIQSVYLKGLFSVQTTSTKKPAAIRQEIVRVLNQMGLSWRESDGYISVAQNSGGKVPPSTPQPNSPNLSSSAPEPKGKYFKPLPSVPTSAQESLEDSGSQSGDSDHMNSSEVIEPSDNIDPSKLSVRFEIYIVKIPLLLGIHGIKFRRLVGHPWEYKELCSRVLEQLRL